jgi:hypothetical protein
MPTQSSSVFLLLGWALIMGSTAAGVVLALRALPPVYRAMLRRQKPWACDICMGFWTTGTLAVGLAHWQHDAQLALAAGPAYPWTLWLLRKLQEPMNPPKLPPLQE